MAIRTTALGGTDWSDDETFDATDLNDTMNALYDKVTTGPAFWLNSSYYTVYDDFESESVGAFTTNTNWTVSGTATIASSTNAGGTGKEVVVGASAPGTHYIETKLFAADKHKHFKIGFGGSTGGGSTGPTITWSVTLGATSANFMVAEGADNTAITSGNTNILVVAKGSDTYDVYAGGKKIIADEVDADPQVKIQVVYVGAGNSDPFYFYVDDVVESLKTV